MKTKVKGGPAVKTYWQWDDRDFGLLVYYDDLDLNKPKDWMRLKSRITDLGVATWRKLVILGGRCELCAKKHSSGKCLK